MRDVRERLIETLKALDYLLPDAQIADAILARWDLTEKPVVTDAVLGEYVRCASVWGKGNADRGERFRSYLDEAGLTIVRSGEAE